MSDPLILAWLRIVDDVRTVFQHAEEYVYIPTLQLQT
jgi:hypothetical protein